jgi:holo-[acyl-carrier protein] synthase
MLCGIDITSIKRIKNAAKDRRFLERVFTERELRRASLRKNPYRHLAGRWAAKEAFFKATGLKVRWNDIEIGNSRNGKPFFRLKSKKLNGVHLSIAYEKDLAVGFVSVDENARLPE